MASINHKIKPLELYFFGVKLGLKTFFTKLRLSKRILEMIFFPLNFWRTSETPLVANSLNLKENDKILDLGSPKLLSLYLASKRKYKIYATDLFDYFIKYCELFIDVMKVKEDNIILKIEDGQKLSFKDNTFDKIFSISVLEHIPSNGDSKTIKELSRVLKKGGLLSLTVPYDKRGRTEYRKTSAFYYAPKNNEKNKIVFYQRLYNSKELYERLIRPSKLKLLKKIYVGQKLKPFGKDMHTFTYPILSFTIIILNKIFTDGPSTNPNKVKNSRIVHLLLSK
jgi:ubiquinone/menaquinone biosynthesis C-methylase UbiE